MQGVVTRLYHVLPPPGNRETGFLPHGAAVSKNFQKYFFVFALKKEVGALLWQNGNEITFRETELAFLIRLFTGYLQLYPPHTKLLLALQRLRGIARARSLLNAVFSFERNNTARDCFRPGRFSVFPFWRRSAVRLESLSLLRGRLYGAALVERRRNRITMVCNVRKHGIRLAALSTFSARRRQCQRRRRCHPCCASRGMSPTPSSTTLGR